ncbi:MAG: DUF3299 domain-containing protein [Bacteroidota bacterium]
MSHWLLFFLYLLFGSAQAQTLVDWEQLSEVFFVEKMDLGTRYVIHKPHFSEVIKALEGKKIEINGYILPLDVDGGAYALSAYPYSACFFCGGAGLASVMDVWFAEPNQHYQLDEKVKLHGILKLNDSGEGLLYLLDEAIEVE